MSHRIRSTSTPRDRIRATYAEEIAVFGATALPLPQRVPNMDIGHSIFSLFAIYCPRPHKGTTWEPGPSWDRSATTSRDPPVGADWAGTSGASTPIPHVDIGSSGWWSG